MEELRHDGVGGSVRGQKSPIYISYLTSRTVKQLRQKDWGKEQRTLLMLPTTTMTTTLIMTLKTTTLKTTTLKTTTLTTTTLTTTTMTTITVTLTLLMTTTSEDFDNSDDDDYDNNNDNDDHNDEDNNNDDDNDNDDNDDNANNANNDDAFVFVYLCRRRTSLKIFACQEQHVCEMGWKGREKGGDG